MPRKKTRRYDLPKIDLNKINLPQMNLPGLDVKKIKFRSPNLKLPWKQVGVAVVLVVMALVMLNLNARLSEYARLTGERDLLGTEVGGLNSTLVVLETQQAYVMSTQAVIDEARKNHMVLEGEKLVIVLTPSNPTVATPSIDEEKLQVPEPWEVWWALFFGQ